MLELKSDVPLVETPVESPVEPPVMEAPEMA
jgi:hypothetical protein